MANGSDISGVAARDPGTEVTGLFAAGQVIKPVGEVTKYGWLRLQPRFARLNKNTQLHRHRGTYVRAQGKLWPRFQDLDDRT